MKAPNHHTIIIILSCMIAVLVMLIPLNLRTATAPTAQPTKPINLIFDGQSAMRFAQTQCDIGPRPTGTKEGIATGDFIIKNIPSAWTIESQTFEYRGKPIRNIIAKRGQGNLIIIGAHYDTRPRADQDPMNPNEPIIGANDGASGVAVLLELARTLPLTINKEIWLAFFDAEDMGGIDGWPFSVGAEYVANSLKTKPQAVIVLDMIGDRDQQIYYEGNSNPDIQKAFFNTAAELGYRANFIPEIKWHMTDDHTPFLARGYPAIDVIDFDYPYWHTLQDTCDKISAESLERVGRTVQRWLTR
jgi:Zn-dependent M28 family amino/carboxypeptidase